MKHLIALQLAVHQLLARLTEPRATDERGGTIVFNGLPPGTFDADIFDIVLRAITVRGSIVGTRQDMIEALDFYARGQIHPTVHVETLDDINDIFDRMQRGAIEGRIVMKY